MVGPDLGHLTHDCAVVLGSAGDADPATFNDKQWLSSLYTSDGTTVYALVNVEYQGNTHPGRCPSGEYIRCWWNTIVLAVSKDGGNSYQRLGPRNGLVAAIPYKYQPDLGFEGQFTPSQIVRSPADGYYYAIVAEKILPRSGEPGQGGSCVMRTNDIADPTSWRAMDGSGAFTRMFIDPYTQDGSASTHVCGQYIETRFGPGSPFHVSLSWNTYPQRWLLVGMDQAGAQPGPTTWGIYYATSKDLHTWSSQRLPVQKTTIFNNTCADPTAIAYPSVIDPASTSRSFDTTGQTAYLYYSVAHYPNFKQTLDRDLVRVPITISK